MLIDLLNQIATTFAMVVEAIGVVVVVASVVLGLSPYVGSLLHLRPRPAVGEVRARLGRGLVFSLEILIAADLLRSIITPSLEDVAVLAVITLVRIALSLSLEYEMRTLPAEEKARADRDDASR